MFFAEITLLLSRANRGNNAARNELLQVTYSELQRIAKRLMRDERPNHTLQPAALVHEAYLHLFSRNVQYVNRSHFFYFATHAMRRILIDYARSREALKRGNLIQPEPISWEELLVSKTTDLWNELAVREVLNRLEKLNARWSYIVNLKFFLGFTEHEIAQVLHISHRTVQREWHLARAWLYRQLAEASETKAHNTTDAFRVGLRIKDRYVLSTELSAGEYSRVYLAKDERRDMKPVIIKVFLGHTNTSVSPEALADQEFRAQSALKQKQLSLLIDKGTLPTGTPFIVMNFIPGKTLREQILPNGLPPEQSLHIMNGLCDALAAIHDSGVLHLDVKPENIILGSDQQNEVTLIDFGSALITDSKKAWIPAGTGAYLAPEWLNGEPSTRTDIFAVGLVAFEMIMGQLPAEQASIEDIVDTLRTKVSLKSANAIAKAIELDAEHRFSSVRELKAALMPLTQ